MIDLFRKLMIRTRRSSSHHFIFLGLFRPIQKFLISMSVYRWVKSDVKKRMDSRHMFIDARLSIHIKWHLNPIKDEVIRTGWTCDLVDTT
jgi:hypothetical protein